MMSNYFVQTTDVGWCGCIFCELTESNFTSKQTNKQAVCTKEKTHACRKWAKAFNVLLVGVFLKKYASREPAAFYDLYYS